MTWIEQAVTFVVGLAALVGAIYAVLRYIDSRIEHRLSDERFLHKLATYVRPAVIFDDHSAVLIDQGANGVPRGYPGQLDVEGMPELITVTAKRYLNHEPLITTLEDEWMDFDISRGPKYQFIYSLRYGMDHCPNLRRRFRLEIFS